MRLATVWGSGTAVGKTLVSAGLMRAAAARSLPSLFLKPVQTGVPDSDGAFVARAAGCQHVVGEHAAAAGLSTSGPSPSAASATPPPQRALTLFAWRPAVSPHVAVEREGRGVSDAELRRATVAEIDRFAAALAASPMADGLPDALALVETAGGVASPSPSRSLQCDALPTALPTAKLAEAPRATETPLPALLVGDAALGGISATVCAAELLRSRGHALHEVVLFEPGGGGGLGNAEAIGAALGVRVRSLPAPPPLPEPLDGWWEEVGAHFAELLDGLPRACTPLPAQPRLAAASSSGAGASSSGAGAGLGGGGGERESTASVLQKDARRLWHPYTSATRPVPCLAVSRAAGVTLTLEGGEQLVDGMSSWWCAVHGYAVPELDAAAVDQIGSMSHVMFGGLTHRPAVRLAELLVEATPQPLQRVFLADSGSVSVEVAIKMALQYWRAQGVEGRSRLLTVRGGYHGDTFGAMGVCDPVHGMHAEMFGGVLAKHLFAPRPAPRFGEACGEEDVAGLRSLLAQHSHEVAALILEPIVQGAGGMHFYSAEYLRRVRQLCDEHNVLLILDCIATGFGRTGALFACDHAAISPDIMCVGKALTGGYMTLGATLATDEVAEGASGGEGAERPVPLMHGPTFMANPLACRVASASVQLLLDSPWQSRVGAIAQQLEAELRPLASSPAVRDVRVLGAIGVVEMEEPLHLPSVQALLVRRGVWLRPFGRMLYTMPPFVVSEAELRRITGGMRAVVEATESALLEKGARLESEVWRESQSHAD